MSAFADLLRDPRLREVDIDGAGRLHVHREILARKRLLREVFTEFHHLFRRLDQRYLSGAGLQIELGAGIAPMRDSYPEVLATDVLPGPGIDRAIDAESMDLADRSVRVFFGQNCFHHFPHPSRFFAEADRTLVAGGGVILLEPYHGPLAAFMFKRLFATEGFDKSVRSWDTPVNGPMSGANQALSYVVFERDRARFLREHPALEIVHAAPVGNYLKYLLSGGLNFRQCWPDRAARVLDAMRFLAAPLDRWLALHHIVVIRKKAAT